MLALAQQPAAPVAAVTKADAVGGIFEAFGTFLGQALEDAVKAQFSRLGFELAGELKRRTLEQESERPAGNEPPPASHKLPYIPAKNTPKPSLRDCSSTLYLTKIEPQFLIITSLTS